jgi:hypothetical protein
MPAFEHSCEPGVQKAHDDVLEAIAATQRAARSRRVVEMVDALRSAKSFIARAEKALGEDAGADIERDRRLAKMIVEELDDVIATLFATTSARESK